MRMYISLFFLLSGCATVTTYVPPLAGPKTADVFVRFESFSKRGLILGGLFEDGARCRGYQAINVDGKTTPSYQFKVKGDEPLTLTFLSQAPEIVGKTYIKCRAVYTFFPESGKQYVIAYRDELERCGAGLAEVTSGNLIDRNGELILRDAKDAMPGVDRCNDEYLPPERIKERTK